MATFKIIVAVDDSGGIGKTKPDGTCFIPWKNTTDMQFFKEQTRGKTVIMGRKTYDSIGHALLNRTNYIISKTPRIDQHATWFINIHDCIQACNGEVYIIGGAEIYAAFLNLKIVSEVLQSHISGHYNCDIMFPPLVNFDTHDKLTLGNETTLHVTCFKYKNIEELQMLSLGRKLLACPLRADRTATGTFSEFGHQLRFDLTNHSFPLMTTRRLFFRGIVEELLLFISGSTDSRKLEAKGVNVWRGNTSREFLDSRALHHLPVGDMGASYGWLMRHFGAKYQTCDVDYTGQGFDQLNYVIRELKTNPTCRRLIISLWDPSNLDNCPLPPCLYNYQFYSTAPADHKAPCMSNMTSANVASANATIDHIKNPPRLLTCMMTQRSSDFAVAGGWNVATGALLTYLIASVTNHEPHALIWNIGDAHIYQNLAEDFKTQLHRAPRCYPKLYIDPQCNIEDYTADHIKLIGYVPHNKIDFKMAI